jgi:iron complex outermembrane receptor protein
MGNIMRNTLLISTALAALAFAPAAFAADVAPAADAAPEQGLTEIVVTATKRETNLQKTPISISVVSADEIKKRHVQSLMDLADGSVPSLRISTFEARQSALTIGIRGIVPDDANQPAREQGVGVYLDGVYLGRQHGLNASLYDVERVEVLKGPQGTLFGRNTEGGALSMVLKAPSGKFGGRVSGGTGNYGAYNGQAHIDLPEVANIAIKLDGVIQHQNATTRNPMAGQAGFNEYHRYGGRVAARWKPVDGLTVDLAYDKSRDENTPFYSQLVTITPTALANLPKDSTGRPLISYGYGRAGVADIGVPQQRSIDITQGVTGHITYKVMPGLELRSITSWRTVSDEQWDNSGGAHRTPVWGPNVNFSRYSLANLEQRQFSQELQAVGSAGNFDYVAGLYYFSERATDWARTPNTNKWNSTLTGYTINDPATYLTAAIARASTAFAKSYAGFGQVTYNATTDLHLTVGGRYTQDKKNGTLYTVNGAATNFTFAIDKGRFDPLVVLSYNATPDLNVYGKFATGYRSGGASSRSVNYRSFGAEDVKSYEVGVKSEFLDKKVRLNVAAYMMDRNNSQVDFNYFILQSNGTVRNTLETVNAKGTTKIRGVEADLTVRPFRGLTANLSYAYTHTTVPKAENTVQEELNLTLVPAVTTPVFQDVYILYTPTNAVSGSVDYELPLAQDDTTLRFHVDANYSDPVHTFAAENVLSDKSFIVNGRISLADLKMATGQKLTLSIWGRNIFNEEHIYRRSAANTALGDYANYNAPRTYGIEANVNF